MSNLPGNPWVDYRESIGNAILAVAFEQRTANLIAYMQLGVSAQAEGIDIADEVASDLAKRLGIELPDVDA